MRSKAGAQAAWRTAGEQSCRRDENRRPSSEMRSLALPTLHWPFERPIWPELLLSDQSNPLRSEPACLLPLRRPCCRQCPTRHRNTRRRKQPPNTPNTAQAAAEEAELAYREARDGDYSLPRLLRRRYDCSRSVDVEVRRHGLRRQLARPRTGERRSYSLAAVPRTVAQDHQPD